MLTRPCFIEKAKGAAAPSERGFTMLELLIVMGMLAGVIAAVFSLYNMQHKVTHVEEDVVEVQQNLRTAMDSISHDLNMAGFMVSGANPVNAFSNNGGLNATDTVTLNTASADSSIARVSADQTVNVATTTSITLTVSSGTQLASFNIGDIVSVLGQGEKAPLTPVYFTVTAKDSTVPNMTLTPNSNGSTVLFKRGSIIAKTGNLRPNTVFYCAGPTAGCGPAVTTCPAGQSCLMKIVNNNADNDSVVATNIANVQFRYILDGSAAENDAPADLSLVRAVRVTVTGQTVQTMSGVAKTRTVTTIAKIRNR